MNITVVTGPPCAGKTHHVTTHRQPHDVVVDTDTLAHALGYPGQHIDWDDTDATSHPARTAALIARRAVLRWAAAEDTAATLWWISTYQPGPDFLRSIRVAGTISVTELIPDIRVCHQRADDDHRPAATHQQINTWYAVHAARHAGTNPSRTW